MDEEIKEQGSYILTTRKDEYGTTYIIELDNGKTFEAWFDNRDDNYVVLTEKDRG